MDSQINPDVQALLDQLNDIALPAEPGWWPPALGWWVVLFSLLLMCAAVYWLFSRYRADQQREAWRKAALAEHQRIHDTYDSGNSETKALSELSVLMRRVALAVKPRYGVASLTDDLWLQSLDSIGQTDAYTGGVGSLLYRHQYQQHPQLDRVAMVNLFELTRKTIVNANKQTSAPQQAGTPVAAL